MSSSKFLGAIAGLGLVASMAAPALAAVVPPAAPACITPNNPVGCVTVNQPPVTPPNSPSGGSTLIAFPSRDFVSTLNYPAGTYTVNVIRNGVTIGTSEPSVPDATGAINVNHPGGSCWVGQTPNLQVGDLVRITDQNGFSNQTTIANVTTGKPVIVRAATPGSKQADGILQVHGTAQTLPGVVPAGPLPVSAIESRLIANKDAFQLNGRRTLRAGGAGKDGTLSYDPVDPVTNPLGTNWTATYKLSEVDLARAVGTGPVFDPVTGTTVTFVGAEPRAMWLGTDPLALTENTIYEVPGGPSGIAKGPTAPCTAPAQTGATLSMAPAGGAFSTPQTVTLSASDAAAQIFYTLDGSVPTTTSSLYASPLSIASTTTLKAVAYNAATATFSDVVSATYTIDSSAPTVGLAAAGPQGTAGNYHGPVTVTVSATDNLGNSGLKLLQYQLDGGPSITTTNGTSILVTGDGNHTVTATATDLAGNTASATPLNFAIDTVPPTFLTVPAGGTFTSVQTVSLGANDANPTTIYYTTDGSVPTTASAVYTAPLSLSANTNLRFMAVDLAGNQSSVGSATFAITLPTTLTTDVTTLVAGGSVTASFDHVANPTPNDWIGIFPVGAPNDGFLDYVWASSCSKAASLARAAGSCVLAMPTTAGTYELRLLANQSTTLLATGPRVTVTAAPPPTFGVDTTSVAAGGSVNATWSGVSSPTANDWIGVFKPGTPNDAFLDYMWTSSCSKTASVARASGSCAVPMPNDGGTYELRLLANQSTKLLATSAAVTVSPPPAATLSLDTTSVAAGGTVTATWANVANPTPNDWIGIFKPGAPNDGFLDYMWTSSCSKTAGAARASGSCTVSMPSTPGTYELRLLANQSTKLLATTSPIGVAVPPPPTVTVGSSSVAAGGTVTVSWSGVTNPTPNDWIGVFKPGAPNDGYLDFVWTSSCTKTASAARGSGSCSFTMPSTPGTYELRLMANQSTTRLASTGTVTVQ